MSEITVRVEGPVPYDDAEEALRSLLHWVRADENVPADVRGHLVPTGSRVDGAMGATLDVLQFAVGSGLSVAAVVVSVLQWRDGLRRAPRVILRRGDTEIALPADVAGDEAALARYVAALEGRPPTAEAVPIAAPAAPAAAPCRHADVLTQEGTDGGGTA